MIHISKTLFTFLFVALLAASCTAVPLVNYENMPVTVADGTYTTDGVKKAIIQAYISLGWRVRDVRSGLIECSLYIREHMAQVEIPYSNKTYSVLYKDSSNLDYDGVNIHRRYRTWAMKLDRRIALYISQL